MRWPFSGREPQIQQVLRSLRDRDLGGVLVVGAPGVGKSRLADECATIWRRRGRAVSQVTATDVTQDRAFGTVAAALPPEGCGPDPLAYLPRAVSALRGSGPGPLLVIDDVQHADQWTAVLVGRLARDRGVNVLLTARAGEDLPRPVTELWRQGVLARLDLEPLDGVGFGAMLTAALGGQVESAGAWRLWRASGGNPLYVRLAVEGDLAAGDLVLDDGVWRWRTRASLSTPLVEVLEHRLGAALDSEVDLREVAELVALAEPLDYDALTALSSAPEVERLETAGVIEVGIQRGVRTVRTAHPLVGELLRTRLGRLRRARLSGALADAQMAGSYDVDPVRLVDLLLDASRAVPAELAVRAGVTSLRRLELDAAIRCAEAAIAAGAGFDAHFFLSLALSWSNRGHDAARACEHLQAAATTPLERAVAVQVACANEFFVLADPRGARERLARVRRQIGDADALAHAETTAMMAWFTAFQARPAEAARLARDASRHELGEVGRMAAAMGQACAQAMTGRPLSFSDVARHFSSTTAGPSGLFISISLIEEHLSGLVWVGDLSSADEVKALLPSGVEHDATFFGDMVRYVTAQLLLARGRVDAALPLFRETATSLRSYDGTGWCYLADLALAQTHAWAGQPGPARDAWAQIERSRHPSFSHRQPDDLLVEAWICEASGERRRALALAGQAVDVAHRAGMWGVEVMALHAIVRFGDPSPADRLDDLATTVDGPRVLLAARHARAFSGHDGGALEKVAQQFEEVGDAGAAADAWSHAALAYRASSMRGSAATAQLHVGRIRGATGLLTPAMTRLGPGAELSQREYEVARLVGQSLSNGAIAERLGISVRTVEGHVYRACTKLGVSSRRDLRLLDPNVQS